MRKIFIAWVLSKVTLADLIYIMKKIMKKDRVKVVEFNTSDGLTGKVYWIKKTRH